MWRTATKEKRKHIWPYLSVERWHCNVDTTSSMKVTRPSAQLNRFHWPWSKAFGLRIVAPKGFRSATVPVSAQRIVACRHGHFNLLLNAASAAASARRVAQRPSSLDHISFFF